MWPFRSSPSSDVERLFGNAPMFRTDVTPIAKPTSHIPKADHGSPGHCSFTSLTLPESCMLYIFKIYGYYLFNIITVNDKLIHIYFIHFTCNQWEVLEFHEINIYTRNGKNAQKLLCAHDKIPLVGLDLVTTV